MRIRIEGVDLPGLRSGPGPDAPEGWPDVHVAVQRRERPTELLGLTPGDAPAVSWTVEATPVTRSDGFDLKGSLSGPPGARFIYLTWGDVDEAGGFRMFRRAKLWIDGVPEGVLTDAVSLGVLVGRLGLTGARGGSLCAAVRPPRIEWRAEKA